MNIQSNFSAASRRGFSSVDAAMLLACVGLVTMLTGPTLNSFRTDARLAGSRDNLRQLGQMHAAYSDANDDYIGGFNWPEGGSQSNAPSLYDLGCGQTQEATGNLAGAQLQLTAILRKATGRCGDDPGAIEWNFNRLPYRRFSHHPLLDWMGASPTDPVVVSPLDVHQQDFQSFTTPDDYHDLPGGDPETAFGTWAQEETVRLWTYASSYLSTAYSYSDSTSRGFFGMPLAPQSNGVLMHVNDSSRIRPQPRFFVRFPSLKSHLFEEFDYSQGLGNQGRFYADPEASVNVLAFDGSSQRIATADANPGWNPGDPRDMESTASLRYRSIDTRFFRDDRDRPEPYAGYHNWTRGGLFGIDFGAGEVDTTDW